METWSFIHLYACRTSIGLSSYICIVVHLYAYIETWRDIELDTSIRQADFLPQTKLLVDLERQRNLLIDKPPLPNARPLSLSSPLSLSLSFPFARHLALHLARTRVRSHTVRAFSHTHLLMETGLNRIELGICLLPVQ